MHPRSFLFYWVCSSPNSEFEENKVIERKEMRGCSLVFLEVVVTNYLGPSSNSQHLLTSSKSNRNQLFEQNYFSFLHTQLLLFQSLAKTINNLPIMTAHSFAPKFNDLSSPRRTSKYYLNLTSHGRYRCQQGPLSKHQRLQFQPCQFFQ